MEPEPPAVEVRVLTTETPGKSLFPYDSSAQSGLKTPVVWEFLGGPMLRTWSFHGCGLASVTGGGTETPQAMQSNKKIPLTKAKRLPPVFLSFWSAIL